MKKIISISTIVILIVITLNPSNVLVKATDSEWWDTSWKYRKEITIDHDMVDADLNNFPILFHNTSSNFSNHAQSDGDDFSFISSDGTTKYNHEIEYYDSNIGELIAWVNIPSLSSTVDTSFYVYYGNPYCSSQENISDTWDDNYVAVWHLQEITGDYIDSTAYKNHGTPSNNVNRTGYNPKIGTNCPEFDGSGNDDYIQVTDDNSLDFSTFTVEFWFNAHSNTHESGIISHNSGQGPGTGWNIEEWHEETCEMMIQNGEGGKVVYDGKDVTHNVWFHTMMCYDDKDILMYRDGEFLNSSSLFIPNAVPRDLFIGCANPSTLRYETDGLLDEIRLSNINRGSAWVNTTYITANNPDTFLSVNIEEKEPGSNIPPTVEITYPEEGQTVSGTITITGTAEDSDGTVKYVEVKIDYDTWETATGTTSWTYQWNTTQHPDGTHTIYARSYDGENYSNEDTVIVNVYNGIDNIPPTMKIETPHFGFIYFTVRGTPYVYIPVFPLITLIIGPITVIVNASDNVGIESITFYVDDEYRHTTTEPLPPPFDKWYIWEWNDKTPFEQFSLKAVARDFAGNEATDIIKVLRIQVLPQP